MTTHKAPFQVVQEYDNGQGGAANEPNLRVPVSGDKAVVIKGPINTGTSAENTLAGLRHSRVLDFDSATSANIEFPTSAKGVDARILVKTAVSGNPVEVKLGTSADAGHFFEFEVTAAGIYDLKTEGVVSAGALADVAIKSAIFKTSGGTSTVAGQAEITYSRE